MGVAGQGPDLDLQPAQGCEDAERRPPLNGREFTSDDVAQTIKLYLAGSQKDVFSDITKTETPDKYTVKVTLNGPKNDFPKEVGA